MGRGRESLAERLLGRLGRTWTGSGSERVCLPDRCSAAIAETGVIRERFTAFQAKHRDYLPFL